MRLFGIPIVVAMTAALAPLAAAPLTFEEAVALAGRTAGDAGAAAPLREEIAALRRSQLPTVRAEVTGNTSRTLDLFADGPLALRYASSVLAFDYPLWGGSSASARIDALRAKLARVETGGGLDDASYARLVAAFTDLYLIQKQTEVTRGFADEIEAMVSRSAELLTSGEISNLSAADREATALAYRSRLLELEARRIEAAARLRLLTGRDDEPTVILDLGQLPDRPQSAAVHDDAVDNAAIAVEESRVALESARNTGSFRALLSGFAGVGAAESEFRSQSSSGSFGIYGLRLNLSYPLIGGSNGVAIAQARAQLAQSVAARDAAIRAANARAAQYRLREQTASQRIVLMEQSIVVAKEREESLKRLIAAGVRPQSDLDRAREERLQREIDLVSARVDRWTSGQLLHRMTAGDGSRP
jgi:outer membrane protein TolC